MRLKELNESEEARKLYKCGLKSGPEIVAKLKARGVQVAPSQAVVVRAAIRILDGTPDRRGNVF